MADGCRLELGLRCRTVGVQPETVLALEVARGAAESVGTRVLTVTHLTDGAHRAGSLHYPGFAADLVLSPGLDLDYREAARAIQAALGGQEFDVLNEVDHIHVEFQPKRAMNA